MLNDNNNINNKQHLRDTKDKMDLKRQQEYTLLFWKQFYVKMT